MIIDQRTEWKYLLRFRGHTERLVQTLDVIKQTTDNRSPFLKKKTDNRDRLEKWLLAYRAWTEQVWTTENLCKTNHTEVPRIQNMYRELYVLQAND